MVKGIDELRLEFKRRKGVAQDSGYSQSENLDIQIDAYDAVTSRNDVLAELTQNEMIAKGIADAKKAYEDERDEKEAEFTSSLDTLSHEMTALETSIQRTEAKLSQKRKQFREDAALERDATGDFELDPRFSGATVNIPTGNAIRNKTAAFNFAQERKKARDNDPVFEYRENLDDIAAASIARGNYTFEQYKTANAASTDVNVQKHLAAIAILEQVGGDKGADAGYEILVDKMKSTTASSPKVHVDVNKEAYKYCVDAITKLDPNGLDSFHSGLKAAEEFKSDHYVYGNRNYDLKTQAPDLITAMGANRNPTSEEQKKLATLTSLQAAAENLGINVVQLIEFSQSVVSTKVDGNLVNEVASALSSDLEYSLEDELIRSIGNVDISNNSFVQGLRDLENLKTSYDRSPSSASSSHAMNFDALVQCVKDSRDLADCNNTAGILDAGLGQEMYDCLRVLANYTDKNELGNFSDSIDEIKTQMNLMDQGRFSDDAYFSEVMDTVASKNTQVRNLFESIKEVSLADTNSAPKSVLRDNAKRLICSSDFAERYQAVIAHTEGFNTFTMPDTINSGDIDEKEYNFYKALEACSITDENSYDNYMKTQFAKGVYDRYDTLVKALQPTVLSAESEVIASITALSSNEFASGYEQALSFYENNKANFQDIVDEAGDFDPSRGDKTTYMTSSTYHCTGLTEEQFDLARSIKRFQDEEAAASLSRECSEPLAILQSAHFRIIDSISQNNPSAIDAAADSVLGHNSRDTSNVLSDKEAKVMSAAIKFRGQDFEQVIHDIAQKTGGKLLQQIEPYRNGTLPAGMSSAPLNITADQLALTNALADLGKGNPQKGLENYRKKISQIDSSYVDFDSLHDAYKESDAFKSSEAYKTKRAAAVAAFGDKRAHAIYGADSLNNYVQERVELDTECVALTQQIQRDQDSIARISAKKSRRESQAGARADADDQVVALKAAYDRAVSDSVTQKSTILSRLEAIPYSDDEISAIENAKKENADRQQRNALIDKSRRQETENIREIELLFADHASSTKNGQEKAAIQHKIAEKLGFNDRIAPENIDILSLDISDIFDTDKSAGVNEDVRKSKRAHLDLNLTGRPEMPAEAMKAYTRMLGTIDKENGFGRFEEFLDLMENLKGDYARDRMDSRLESFLNSGSEGSQRFYQNAFCDIVLKRATKEEKVGSFIDSLPETVSSDAQLSTQIASNSSKYSKVEDHSILRAVTKIFGQREDEFKRNVMDRHFQDTDNQAISAVIGREYKGASHSEDLTRNPSSGSKTQKDAADTIGSARRRQLDQREEGSAPRTARLSAEDEAAIKRMNKLVAKYLEQAEKLLEEVGKTPDSEKRVKLMQDCADIVEKAQNMYGQQSKIKESSHREKGADSTKSESSENSSDEKKTDNLEVPRLDEGKSKTTGDSSGQTIGFADVESYADAKQYLSQHQKHGDYSIRSIQGSTSGKRACEVLNNGLMVFEYDDMAQFKEDVKEAQKSANLSIAGQSYKKHVSIVKVQNEDNPDVYDYKVVTSSNKGVRVMTMSEEHVNEFIHGADNQSFTSDDKRAQHAANFSKRMIQHYGRDGVNMLSESQKATVAKSNFGKIGNLAGLWSGSSHADDHLKDTFFVTKESRAKVEDLVKNTVVVPIPGVNVVQYDKHHGSRIAVSKNKKDEDVSIEFMPGCKLIIGQNGTDASFLYQPDDETGKIITPDKNDYLKNPFTSLRKDEFVNYLKGRVGNTETSEAAKMVEAKRLYSDIMTAYKKLEVIVVEPDKNEASLLINGKTSGKYDMKFNQKLDAKEAQDYEPKGGVNAQSWEALMAARQTQSSAGRQQ